MRITKVEYRRLVSDGNFNNESHGAEAFVSEYDDPIAVHAELVEWVDGILKKKGVVEDEAARLTEDIYTLQAREGRLSRECAELELKASKMIEFLKAHGVDIPESELPF